MPVPEETNPDLPKQRPSAIDGLVSVLAAAGIFAVAAKSHRIALRSAPQAKIEAARQIIAKTAIKQVEAIASHPVFKTLQKAFVNSKMVGPGPLEQIVREIDGTQLGIVQDLWMASQLGAKDTVLKENILADILTKYDRNIPQLAAGRHQRLLLKDLQKVTRGTKFQKSVEQVLGIDGSKFNELASNLGISPDKLGELRVDPWAFADPNKPQDFFNLSRLNPLRIFNWLEQRKIGGIPLFRMRSDPRGNKLGTAMFASKFEDGKETTNAVLKLLSGGKEEHGDLAIVGGVAWSRRSAKDPFKLLEGPFSRAGQKLELTMDKQRGQQFFLHNASAEEADRALYGIEEGPKNDWERFKRFFGIDFGSRGGYSKGQFGTVLDDLLREPMGYDPLVPYEGAERKRAWLMAHDPTGLVGSVKAKEIQENMLGNIGGWSPVTGAIGGQLYVTPADTVRATGQWANALVSKPLYLLSKFGINVKPGKNALTTLGKVAGLGLGAYAGIEALRYADFALWDMPSRAAKTLLAGGEYARQAVLGGTGIAGGVEKIEEETPGLFTSPLSKAVQIGGLVTLGAIIGARKGSPKWAESAVKAITNPAAEGVSKATYNTIGRYIESYATKNQFGAKAIGGILLGTGAGGLLGLAATGGDITVSKEDVAERFRGDRKVAYHASAGWMLGRDKFTGGNIRYFRESGYNTFGTAYQDVAVYGSQSDKWKYGSWLPTLQNWGGIRRLINPYYAENRNFATRPYPATSGQFGEVPIFGPLLQSTIGSLIKPTRYRDPYGYSYGGPGPGAGSIAQTGGGYGSLANMNAMPQEVAAGRLAGAYAGSSGYRGFSRTEIEHMGFRYGNTLPITAQTPTSIGQAMSSQFRAIEEFTGLRGFQMQVIRENLFGNAYPSMKRPILAQSGAMTSTARHYYDVEPGGLFGLCFHGDTLIDTSDGWKPIRNVRVGDSVMSKDGVYREVVNTYSRKPEQLLRMKVANISTDIIATPEHVFPVYKFYPCHEKNATPCVPGSRKFCSAPGKLCKPKDKPAYWSRCGKVDKTISLEDTPLSKISKNDYLVIPGPKPAVDSLVIDLSKFTNRAYSSKWIYNRASQSYADIYEILDKNPNTTRPELRQLGFKDADAKEALYIYRNMKVSRFSRFVTVDEDLAWVLGWWVAEGSNESNGRISFAMHENERHWAERIGQIVTERFGNTYSISSNSGRGIVVRIQCIPLQLITEALLGCNAHDKHVHSSIKTMPVEELTQFFQGAVEGDGWYNEFKGGFGSVSAALCKDVFQIGIALGLKGSLVLNYTESANGHYPNGKPRKDCVRSYIQWGGESANRLYNLMTGSQNEYEGRFDSRSFIYNGDLYVRVVSIEEETVSNDLVYDLEIEDVHYYTAALVLAHNSEFPRRLLQRPTKQPEVNFIPNSLPRFLPGSLSEFENDRTWPIDFSRGDPYTKIAQGEARLPGPGYETLHELHGGSAYDVLDSFIILADAAPYSQAYRITKQEVERLISEGQIAPEWIRKYQIAVEQTEKRSQYRPFTSSKYRGIREVTIKKALSPTTFESYEHPGIAISMAGTTLGNRSDIEMLAQYQREGMSASAAKAQVAAAKAEMYKFLKEREGKQLRVSLTGRRGGKLEVEAKDYMEKAGTLGVGRKASDLRDQGPVGKAYSGAGKLLGEAGAVIGGITGLLAGSARAIGRAEKGSLAARIGGAAIGMIMGGVAGGWAENKFTGDFSAVEHYERFNKYGTAFADWHHPIDSFVRTWAHSAASTLVDYTPVYRQKQRDIEDYFDKLKFAKNQMLIAHGAAPDKLEPTMVGLDYRKLSEQTPGVTRAIPASERKYFRQFAAELDPNVRSRIIRDVPDYMKSIYLAIWKNNQKGESFDNPELDHAYSEYVMPNINTSADRRVSEYFETRNAPGPQSGYWHPAVSADAVKYKAIEAIGGDPHVHGLYSSEGARIDAFQPGVANIADDLAASYSSLAPREDFTMIQKLLRGKEGKSDLYIAPSYIFAPGGRIDIMQENRDRYRDYYDQAARGKGIW